MGSGNKFFRNETSSRDPQALSSSLAIAEKDQRIAELELALAEERSLNEIQSEIRTKQPMAAASVMRTPELSSKPHGSLCN